MLIEAKLSHGFWSEAARFAIHVSNCSPHTALKNKTPFEMWHNHKPVAYNLWSFGPIEYAHIEKTLQKKVKLRNWNQHHHHLRLPPTSPLYLSTQQSHHLYPGHNAPANYQHDNKWKKKTKQQRKLSKNIQESHQTIKNSNLTSNF